MEYLFISEWRLANDGLQCWINDEYVCKQIESHIFFLVQRYDTGYVPFLYDLWKGLVMEEEEDQGYTDQSVRNAIHVPTLPCQETHANTPTHALTLT